MHGTCSHAALGKSYMFLLFTAFVQIHLPKLTHNQDFTRALVVEIKNTYPDLEHPNLEPMLRMICC
jgi:hypothetical protein